MSPTGGYVPDAMLPGSHFLHATHCDHSIVQTMQMTVHPSIRFHWNQIMQCSSAEDEFRNPVDHCFHAGGVEEMVDRKTEYLNLA